MVRPRNDNVNNNHFLSEGPGAKWSLLHPSDHLEAVSPASRKGIQSFPKHSSTSYLQLRAQDEVRSEEPCCSYAVSVVSSKPDIGL